MTVQDHGVVSVAGLTPNGLYEISCMIKSKAEEVQEQAHLANTHVEGSEHFNYHLVRMERACNSIMAQIDKIKESVKERTPYHGKG